MKKILIALGIAACGGGGGGPVDGSKKLRDLTPAELNLECNYAYDTYPDKAITCADGSTKHKGETGDRNTDCAVTTNTVPAACTLTVGQAETCESDLYAESDMAVCSTSTSIPPSCAPLLSSACQGTGRTEPMTRAELVDFIHEFAR